MFVFLSKFICRQVIRVGFAKRMLEEIQSRGFDQMPDKYVCSDCIGSDYAVKEFIDQNATHEECNYCRKSFDNPIALDIEQLMYFLMEGIMFEYDEVENCVGRNDGEWDPNIDRIDGYDLIMDDYLNLGIDNEELLEDLRESISDKQYCPRDPYGPRRHDEDFYNWKQFCKLVKHQVRYVFYKARNARSRYDYSQTKPHEILNQMGDYVRQTGLIRTLPRNSVFYRGRLHKTVTGFTTIKQLGPPETAQYSNRMSPAGISMFYGATDQDTAIKEILDGRSYGTIGQFKTLKRLNVLDLNAITKPPSLFDRKRRHLRSPILFLIDFLKDLTKPISKDGMEHIQYVPTQIVTEYFRYVFKRKKINGIIYPSSRNNGGKCCVLFFDGKNCTQDSLPSDEQKGIDLCLISSSIKTVKVGMSVTAWVNKSGVYGIRVGGSNAVKFFDRSWDHIELLLDKTLYRFKINNSFWTTCPEIRGKEIGQWLLSNNLAPWPKYHPPELDLNPIGENRFKLVKHYP